MVYVYYISSPFGLVWLFGFYSLHHKKYLRTLTKIRRPFTLLTSLKSISHICIKYFTTTQFCLHQFVAVRPPFCQISHAGMYKPTFGQFWLPSHLTACSTEALLHLGVVVVAVRFTEFCCCSCSSCRLALLVLHTFTQ